MIREERDNASVTLYLSQISSVGGVYVEVPEIRHCVGHTAGDRAYTARFIAIEMSIDIAAEGQR